MRLRVTPAGPRVVLDTNLFVAAYWSPRSASAGVVRLCEDGHLCLLISDAIRRELLRILDNAHTDRAFQQRVAALLEDAEPVAPAETRRWVADDPDDDKFVACAVAGDAHYLVSSDAHLLNLVHVEGTRVLKPGALLRELGCGE